MRRQLILLLIVAAAFGVLVPAFKGFGFLDRRLIIAYACLSAVFAVPGTTDAFSEQPRAPWMTMVRVWLLSWLYATAILAIGLIIVNLPAHGPGPLLPRTSLLVASECLGLALSASVVAIAALVTRSRSTAATIRMFRTMFLIVIVAFFVIDRYVPSSMTTAALTRALFIASAICGAVALVVAARFPNTKADGTRPSAESNENDLRH